MNGAYSNFQNTKKDENISFPPNTILPIYLLTSNSFITLFLHNVKVYFYIMVFSLYTAYVLLNIQIFLLNTTKHRINQPSV